MTEPSPRAERQAALSRTAVAKAAVAMVAEAGFDELTVRGVARRLAVSAPSLYEYVASKDDLIDLVVADILDAAAATWDPPVEWEPLLRYAALWWHEVLREHEAVYMSVLRRPMSAPVALDMVDRFITSLTAAGLSPDEAVAAYGQFFGYVVGTTALVRTRAIARAAQGSTAEEAQDRSRALLDSVDPVRYPGIRTGREALVGLAGDAIVAEGLEALIAGLRYRLAAKASTGARPAFLRASRRGNLTR
ncbi:MAG: TetR family transcriptional regulator [Actinobacteria bacterium]|nr:TetR family transcriptional regulator [Actinomycetota bacterium]MCA1722259.1 TetR family transcriptional regulator [Actinomycetota bacterium]